MKLAYFILIAVHIVAIVVTGVMWLIVDLWPKSSLKTNMRDIRAVHFGSLYLVPWFLGLWAAFELLHVPDWHRAMFPIGLGSLVFFSGIGYVFPKPADLDPFYYWTRGWPLFLSMIGLVILAVCLFWTGAVLVVYAMN